MSVTIQRTPEEKFTINWVTSAVIAFKINDELVGHLQFLDHFKQCYPDIDILEEDFLFMNILGITDEYLIDGFRGTEIQVCAGTWKKITGTTYWTFEKDFEWFMDETE